jgi:hypothetical protein
MGGTVSLAVAIQFPERVSKGGGSWITDGWFIAIVSIKAVWAKTGCLCGISQSVDFEVFLPDIVAILFPRSQMAPNDGAGYLKNDP